MRLTDVFLTHGLLRAGSVWVLFSRRQVSAAARKGPQVFCRQRTSIFRTNGTYMFGNGLGMHLVLERSSLSAAIRCHGLFAPTVWDKSKPGYRSPADAF